MLIYSCCINKQNLISVINTHKLMQQKEHLQVYFEFTEHLSFFVPKPPNHIEIGAMADLMFCYSPSQHPHRCGNKSM